MATKQALLTTLAADVISVGDSKLIGTDVIANIRQYDVQVYYINNSEGHALKGTQAVYVKDEDTPEEDAYFGSRQIKNHVSPAVEVDTKKAAFNGILTQYGAANVSFSGVEKFDGLDVGIFTLFAGEANEAKIGVTMFAGDTAPTIVPYFPKA